MAQDTTPVLPDDDNAEVSEQDTGKDLLQEETSKTPQEESKDDSKEESKEQSDEEAKDESEEPEKSEEGDQPNEESEESKDSEDENTETDEESEEVDPKEQARRDYRERQQAKRKLEQQLDSEWRTQSEEELVEQGVDPNEAKIEALRQQMELQNYKQYVSETNNIVDQDASSLMLDYDIYNPKSKDFDPQFTAKALSRWEREAHVEYNDPRTKDYIVRADFGPYETFSELAEIRGESVKRGKVEGQKATEKNLAAAEPSSSANTKSETSEEKDPMLIGFDRGASDY